MRRLIFTENTGGEKLQNSTYRPAQLQFYWPKKSRKNPRKSSEKRLKIKQNSSSKRGNWIDTLGVV